MSDEPNGSMNCVVGLAGYEWAKPTESGICRDAASGKNESDRPEKNKLLRAKRTCLYVNHLKNFG